MVQTCPELALFTLFDPYVESVIQKKLVWNVRSFHLYCGRSKHSIMLNLLNWKLFLIIKNVKKYANAMSQGYQIVNIIVTAASPHSPK